MLFNSSFFFIRRDIFVISVFGLFDYCLHVLSSLLYLYAMMIIIMVKYFVILYPPICFNEIEGYFMAYFMEIFRLWFFFDFSVLKFTKYIYIVSLVCNIRVLYGNFNHHPPPVSMKQQQRITFSITWFQHSFASILGNENHVFFSA